MLLGSWSDLPDFFASVAQVTSSTKEGALELDSLQLRVREWHAAFQDDVASRVASAVSKARPIAD